MELSVSLSAVRRRAVLAAGLAGLLCAASGVRASQPLVDVSSLGEIELAAQDPAPQQPAAQQADPLKFTHDGNMLLIWQIKPDRAADFELGWKTIKEALAANANPDIKAFGDSFTVSKVNLPAGAPTVMYVFQLMPVSKTYSYNPVTLLFTTLKAPAGDPAATTPPPPPPGTFTDAQAREVFDKINGSWIDPNGISPWPLAKMPW
jgi:hypothetical protein